MGILIKLGIITVLGAFATNYVLDLLTAVPPLPKLEAKWWGPGQPQKVDQSVKPFKINISQEILDDLNDRLELLPDLALPLEGIGFEYGFNSEYLQEVVKHWHDKYNWREREALLNGLPQFKTYVDGLDLHFIHVKPKNVPEKTKIIPLLLLHGWPGSVREFYGIIPLLTTPKKQVDFVFEVIAPSLPGYGFSDAASKPGLGTAHMAVIMKNLMKKLGFDKFYVQGGDWGSIIASNMASIFKDDVLGIHLNMCFSMAPLSNIKWILGSLWPTLVVKEEHVKKLYPIGSIVVNLVKEMGYMHLQATKPDTAGTSLTDSPAGLAAYILEKFSTWTNPAWQSRKDGGLTVKYSLDDLLDNIMIYWVTGSITTSMRLYSETFNKAHSALGFDSIPVEVPTACAQFPNELAFQPEFILKDKYWNLVQVSNMPRGGHFAAFEEPLLLANDVWSAVKLMLQKNK